MDRIKLPPLEPKSLRNRTVQVKVTAEEKLQIERAARESGRTASGFLLDLFKYTQK
jgi:hypothetical protein